MVAHATLLAISPSFQDIRQTLQGSRYLTQARLVTTTATLTTVTTTGVLSTTFLKETCTLWLPPSTPVISSHPQSTVSATGTGAKQTPIGRTRKACVPTPAARLTRPKNSKFPISRGRAAAEATWSMLTSGWSKMEILGISMFVTTLVMT